MRSSVYKHEFVLVRAITLLTYAVDGKSWSSIISRAYALFFIVFFCKTSRRISVPNYNFTWKVMFLQDQPNGKGSKQSAFNGGAFYMPVSGFTVSLHDSFVISLLCLELKYLSFVIWTNHSLFPSYTILLI